MDDDSLRNLNLRQNNYTITSFELTYKHYNTIFALACDELADLLKSEFPYDEPRIIDERRIAIRMVSKLYLKYIQVSNKFIKCHKYLANPQKRRYLRKLCDGCICRVLELKHELVSLKISDFHFIDPSFFGLKINPQDMDIIIPEYFKDGLSEIDQYKKDIVKHFLETKQKNIMNENAVTKEEKLVRLGIVFIRMLQGHERTRQAREYFRAAHKQYLIKKLKNQEESRKTQQLKVSKHKAAIVIQSFWRKYHSRKFLDSQYLTEMKFLNLLPTEDRSNNIFNTIENERMYTIKMQETDYLVEKEKIKQDILTYQVPRMMEELEERIRGYFDEYKEVYGELPVFPTEEEGGSAAMLVIIPVRPTVSDEEAGDDKKKTKDLKSDKTSSTKSEKSSKTSDSEESEPSGYTLQISKFIPTLLELVEEYKKTWANKELTNFNKFDKDILIDEVKKEVGLMVRLHVDEKMRAELLRLSDALRKDSKKKGKKGKSKGKKKKGKGDVDLTPDRTLESLVKELVYQGIIVDYEKHSLKEYLGEYNYSGSIQQHSESDNVEPFACLADIRRVINEYCILPMGSEAIHSSGIYVKSILLAGPNGSGKKLLIQSICSEIGATMMDLSATNIEGKYPGKEGLKMFIHLISKVGRLLQPTIIYIKDAENNFWKKKPKNCPLTQPGRLKNVLPKFLKKIKDTDRILLCGSTSLPFNANPKGLCKCYSKIICILNPDFNCRSNLWRQFLTKAEGNMSNFLHLSILSNITDGFVASQIQNTVSQVLTNRRSAFQRKLPLCASDFKLALAEYIPIYEEERKEYISWLKKLPMEKKRSAFYEKEREEGPEEVEETSEGDDY